jgi:drug/metabolite transporter (DMT)-like permease
MCILAGLAITIFYVVTRSARGDTPLPAFMGWTMAGSAALALPFTLIEGKTVGYDWPSWAWLGGILVFTTILGHGLMNRAARQVSLFALNLVIVIEPAIGIAMGAVLFGEKVTGLQLGGGVLLAAAVVVGLRSVRARVAAVTTP